MSRLWVPSDGVGLTGVQWFDSKQQIVTAAPVGGLTPVNRVTALNYNSGATPDYAASARDDYRPSLGLYNQKQTIDFDGNTRQLPMTTANLPAGPGDKFWFGAFVAQETRNGDYYPLGYGGGNGSGVAYKMRVGSKLAVDIGNYGFDVGTDPIVDVVLLVHTYEQTGQKSQAWLNKQTSPTIYTANSMNTSAQNARIGSWPQYGGYAKHKFGIWGGGYGKPIADDILRMLGFASWQLGDNGQNLAANSPYVSAPPMFGADAIYIGAGSRATRYLGARQDAALYLGGKVLF